MHCRFASIKLIENLETDPAKNSLGIYYGIKIIKGKSYEEIVSPTKSVIDDIFNRFSNVCVLSNINTKYTQVYGLGKGAFCKVFQARRNR
jgi:hypothetical protein